MKLKDLAKLVAGTLVGNGELNIKRVVNIDEAGANDLVFVLEDKYLASALRSKAAAIVAHQSKKIEKKAAILVSNPRLAMAQILASFAPKKKNELYWNGYT